MTLVEPAYLVLLLLVPLLALGAFLAGRQRRLAWEKLVAPRLRRKLAAPASPLSRWLSLGSGLLAFTLLIICLAQPIAGEQEISSLVKGRNLIIAVDASRSMLVRDAAPDRLNAAKAAVYELLESFPEDRIGLLAFAGSAAMQSPLTIDHNALRETLDQLDETNVPSGGSNLADAINLATRTFQETGQSTHGLIVISDGELHEGELEDASADAKRAGVFIITIGMGTREGDFVPDSSQKDGRFRDQNGKPVLSRLNATPLRNLALATKGLYLEGTGGNFTQKIDAVINHLDSFEDEGRVQKTPIPRFQWFLIPAMFFLLASLFLRLLWAPARPPALKSAPLVTGLITFALLASSPKTSAWTNPLEGFFGSQALKKGDSEKALEHFEKAAEKAEPEKLAQIRFGQGTANYQAGRHEEAGAAFSEALLSENPTLQRDAHSQLANTLYHRSLKMAQANQGDLKEPISLLEDALEHYNSSLAIDKKFKPATKNRKVAAEALEQLKQAQQQQQQQQQNQPEEGEENQENQENQDQQPQDQNDDNQQGEQNNESQQQESNEQEQQNQENNQDQEQGEGEEQREEEKNEQGNEGDSQEEKGEQEQNQNNQDQDQGEQGEQGEQSQENKQQTGQQSQQTQQAPAPREGETAEEFARRILEENADFQREALRKHGRQYVPTKDW